MRKTYLLLAMALVLGACQREQDYDAGPPQTRLTARMEGATRTVLTPAGLGVSQVFWEEGDQLAVSIDGSVKTSVFSLEEGAGTTQAVFSGMGKGDNYTAVYPADIVKEWDGNGVYVDLPTEQRHVTGSFGPGAFPMAAASGNANLEFRNIESILKLSFKGKQTITRIVFRPNDPGIKVSGPTRISLATPYEPVLEMLSEALDSVVLVTGGVTLREDMATDFYLVLPAQTYKGGFTVTVRSAGDCMEKVYGADFTMKRAQLHAADPIQVLMNNELEVSSFLKGQGTQKDPLQVASLPDLLLVQQAVNAGASIPTDTGVEVPAADACYLLTADIDLSPACGEALKRNWTPIGREGVTFNGHFNGGGHRIGGLYISAKNLSAGDSLQEYGLFGYTDSRTAVLENLTVEGSVNGILAYAGLVAGYFCGTILHCQAEGEVVCEEGVTIGGVAGYGGMRTEGCINRADVKGKDNVGGIVGYCLLNVVNSFNYGPVCGETNVGGIAGTIDDLVYGCRNYATVSIPEYWGYNIGGIVGNQNTGQLVACLNNGDVSGFQFLGGITGYSRQGAFLWNCVNRGTVSGTRLLGGITGVLSTDSSGWGTPTTMRGCLNLGEVQMVADGEFAGALCGVLDGENPGDMLDSESSWNAWLYDPEKGLGMKEPYGELKGKTEDVRSFTDAELRKKGTGSALEWLNSWTGKRVNAIDGSPLQGWVANPEDGYPTLCGYPAQEPGHEHAVFTVTGGDDIFNVPGGELEVSVFSSLPYSVKTPSWIEETGTESYETDPFTVIHRFVVKPNDTGASRSGKILFVNDEGTERPIAVRQREPYLRADKTGMVLAGEGGSQRLELATSMAWTASSDAAWCRVGPSEGVGDQLLAVRALENPDKAARSARVTIASTDGTLQHILQVVQSGGEETETGDWKKQPFVHQSLAMRFTATWCGWCPRMNRTVHRAMELYPGHILHLALHEPGSDLPFRDVSPLLGQYEVHGYPAGIIDGRMQLDNKPTSEMAPLLVEIVKETEDFYGTHTGVDISSTFSGRNVEMDINAYVKTAGDYKITVLLVEDGIIYSQADYEEGSHSKYQHDDVARVAVTDVLGEAFTVDKDFTVKSFHYSISVPSPYVVEGLRVLVYIQRSFGSMERRQSGNYGDYYVDNCGTAMVGGRLKLALEGDSGGSGGGGGEEGEGNEGIVPGDDINLK